MNGEKETKMWRKITENLEACEVSLDEAKTIAKNFDYMITHMISDLKYGEMEQDAIDWDELTELRAFSEKEELHVFDAEDGKKAIHVREISAKENPFPGDFHGLKPGEEKEISGKSAEIIKYYLTRSGKKLAVKEYLRPDEDGQAVVAYTRPFSIQ